jgi:hypothetical protein
MHRVKHNRENPTDANVIKAIEDNEVECEIYDNEELEELYRASLPLYQKEQNGAIIKERHGSGMRGTPRFPPKDGVESVNSVSHAMSVRGNSHQTLLWYRLLRSVVSLP